MRNGVGSNICCAVVRLWNHSNIDSIIQMKKRINRNDKAAAMDLLLPNMSDKEVAEKLNLPLTTVRGHAANNGIRKLYKEWSDNELEILRAEYPEGIDHCIEALGGKRTRWQVVYQWRKINSPK